jgi:hypothetical protein
VKKFNQILSLYVEDNIDLVKVRLKVDPKDKNIVDYKDFDGYEGYILKEGAYYNVFFLQENLPVLQVPFSIISVTDIEDTNKFDTVKMAALKLLDKKGCLTDSKIRKIGMCNEVEFFEQYLREEGVTDSEIKDLYKNNLFENVLTEKVNWGRLAGLAATGVFAPGYAADLVAKKTKERTGEIFGKILDPRRKIFGNDEDPNKKQYGTSSGNKGLTISPNRYRNAGPGNLPTILKSDFYYLSRKHVQQGKVVETPPKSNKFVSVDNTAVFTIDLNQGQELIKYNNIPYIIDDIAKSDPSKLGLVMSAYSKGDFKGFLDRLKDITPAKPSAPTSSSTASVQATTPGAINVSSTPSSNSATTAPSTTASTATIP